MLELRTRLKNQSSAVSSFRSLRPFGYLKISFLTTLQVIQYRTAVKLRPFWEFCAAFSICCSGDWDMVGEFGDVTDMVLRPGMAMDREKWRCGIMRRTSDPRKRGNNGR